MVLLKVIKAMLRKSKHEIRLSTPVVKKISQPWPPAGALSTALSIHCPPHVEATWDGTLRAAVSQSSVDDARAAGGSKV